MRDPSTTLGKRDFESTLARAHVAVWEHFLPEDRLYYSDGFYQLVGADPAEARAIDEFWASRIHPDDGEHLRSSYTRFLNTQLEAFEACFRVRHEDGRWISLLVRARWVPRGDSGEGRVAFGHAIDVTESHMSAGQQPDRDQRFRMSVSALPAMVYDLDMRSGLVERHGLKRVLGYDTLKAADGSDTYAGWFEIVHPDDRARFLQTLESHRAKGTDYEVRYRVRHADGHWCRVRQHGTYALGPDGKVLRAFGVVEDITEVERQQGQLQLQSAVMEHMSEGVLLVNRAGTILFANPALETMYGYERGELAGLNSHVLSFRSAEAFDGLLDTAFRGTEGGKTAVIDLEGRRKDNALLPIQCTFASLLYDGQPCVVVVISGVGSLRRMERELMSLATSVQQRTSGSLHEGVGQALSGIAMLLKGLEQRLGSRDEQGLRVEVEQITSLVNDTIRDTRLLARGLSPVRATGEGLIEGFRELANDMRARFGLEVQLELDFPVERRLDETTADNLYRIAEQAVHNAARHSRVDGCRLWLRVTGPDVELVVQDEGVGFDPLGVAESSSGLRMMRFRALLLGGYLSVESRPGAGTVIRCRCPARSGR